MTHSLRPAVRLLTHFARIPTYLQNPPSRGTVFSAKAQNQNIYVRVSAASSGFPLLLETRPCPTCFQSLGWVNGTHPQDRPRRRRHSQGTS